MLKTLLKLSPAVRERRERLGTRIGRLQKERLSRLRYCVLDRSFLPLSCKYEIGILELCILPRRATSKVMQTYFCAGNKAKPDWESKTLFTLHRVCCIFNLSVCIGAPYLQCYLICFVDMEMKANSDLCYFVEKLVPRWQRQPWHKRKLQDCYYWKFRSGNEKKSIK